MATVNVYTYYTHKLAHEKMPRPKAARCSFRLPRPHPLLSTLVVALVLFLLLPPAQPLAALTGCALALGAVHLISGVTIRTQKVWRALNGMSLDLDDLEVLCGR